MKYLIVLTAVFACAMSAPHSPKLVLPRLPLSVLLSGKAVSYDANGPKIVGGTEVTPNSLPFQISLQVLLSGIGYHICGGSILNATTILTAAHCVVLYSSPERWQVVAGEHAFDSYSGLEQNRNVATIKIHENYDPDTFANDIALLFLSSPLDLSVPSAQPINLPAFMNEPAANTIFTVSGWGHTEYGGERSNELRSVQVPYVSDSFCIDDEAYGSSYTESMLCAGDTNNGGEDSCQGDSGGPLFTGNGTAAVQHGIVSFGAGCGVAYFPGVYTQVSYFINWIATNRGF